MEILYREVVLYIGTVVVASCCDVDLVSHRERFSLLVMAESIDVEESPHRMMAHGYPVDLR